MISLILSSMSELFPQPASPSASTRETRIARCRHQHFGPAADVRWRLRVGHDQVGPAPGRGVIAGAPCGKRQKLARAVVERAVAFCERLEPRAHFLVGRGVHEDEAGTHLSEVLQDLADAAIGRERIIGLDRFPRIALRRRLGGAEACQRTIAGRPLGRDLGEGRLGLPVLALLGEHHGGLELRARFCSFLGFPPLIAAPAAHPEDEDQRDRDEDRAVLLPQLLEPLAAYFLVDFLKNIGHRALRAHIAG
jgi:hypothetical protein